MDGAERAAHKGQRATQAARSGAALSSADPARARRRSTAGAIERRSSVLQLGERAVVKRDARLVPCNSWATRGPRAALGRDAARLAGAERGP